MLRQIKPLLSFVGFLMGFVELCQRFVKGLMLLTCFESSLLLSISFLSEHMAEVREPLQ